MWSPEIISRGAGGIMEMKLYLTVEQSNTEKKVRMKHFLKMELAIQYMTECADNRRQKLLANSNEFIHYEKNDKEISLYDETDGQEYYWYIKTIDLSANEIYNIYSIQQFQFDFDFIEQYIADHYDEYTLSQQEFLSQNMEKLTAYCRDYADKRDISLTEETASNAVKKFLHK